MEIIKIIGNDVHPSIQLEVDCPSNYDDGKLPILDLRVWISKINGHDRILHEFYSKDISSKAVIHAKSALSWQQERSPYARNLMRDTELFGRCIMGSDYSACQQDGPASAILWVHSEISI